MFYLSPEPGEDFPEGQVAGKRYYPGRAFAWGQFQYSAAGATHAKFMELGFTQVIIERRPDDRFYIVSGPDNEGKYNATPRDLKQTQLSFVQKELTTTQTMLMATDWLFIRANEMPRGTPVAIPSAVLTSRNEVRAVCDTNCDLIVGTKDIPELEALIKAPAEIPEDAMANELVFITNPEPHLEPYPTLDAQEFLTRELLAPKPAKTPARKRAAK